MGFFVGYTGRIIAAIYNKNNHDDKYGIINDKNNLENQHLEISPTIGYFACVRKWGIHHQLWHIEGEHDD
jgi:hypothetical protein